MRGLCVDAIASGQLTREMADTGIAGLVAIESLLAIEGAARRREARRSKAPERLIDLRSPGAGLWEVIR